MQFDITRNWYQDKPNFLLPLSWLFGVIATTRRLCYRVGLFKTNHFSVPVIVVGNITVGGTGKTPFVIWLAEWLRTQGYTPGIVSRGLGGKNKHRQPHVVQMTDTAEQVGDEALLLVRKSNCPMVICANRPAAVRKLLDKFNCDIVISDDGLQHYAMARDVEVVMVDGARRFGNSCLLPAGPLREPVSRLDEVDMVVVNGGDVGWISAQRVIHQMKLELSNIRPVLQTSLVDYALRANPPYILGTTVHAVAAIGHPERFFQTLRNAGYNVIPHAFPDHYLFKPNDLVFNDDLPIVMTAKDAVKCEAFATENMWCAEVTTKIDERVPEKLTSLLRDKEKRI